jgi:hypothetical protein
MMVGERVRRLAAVVAAASVVAGAPACTSDDDSGGDDMTELRWDLRDPTTTRDLGSDSDQMVNVRSPRGELLDVEIELPGLTYRGAHDMVTAVPEQVELSGPPQPVAEVILYDVDVESVEGLRPILQRFERDWGFTAADCAEVRAFLDEAETRMAEAGGDPMAVDWGLTQAVSFAGEPRNGVEPGIVVRLPPAEFSTFSFVKWDPAAGFGGERPVVGSAAGEDAGEDAADTPCTS